MASAILRKAVGQVKMGRKGYAWAILAGSNAALAAISAKLISFPVNSPAAFYTIRCVVMFNVVMWGCYVQSLRDLSTLQATATNFAANFLTSGFAGSLLFGELLKLQWFAGAFLIVIGVLVLSTSTTEERKERLD
ncbi:hypothetical protein MLD38_024803 [Melastoma candidum]|uniref:Uncharacterized protein n=1 Tax=Melastoma candidum TaxID=119954 RepID=A0ACB9NUR7_9MYRT|nr:hypothetical protein MLD38_024803 [Melastoma candidum]